MTVSISEKSRYHFADDHMPETVLASELDHLQAIFISADEKKIQKLSESTLSILVERGDEKLLRSHGISQNEAQEALRWFTAQRFKEGGLELAA